MSGRLPGPAESRAGGIRRPEGCSRELPLRRVTRRLRNTVGTTSGSEWEEGVLGAGLYRRGPKAESERDSETETRDRDKAGQERGRTEAQTQWRQGHRGPTGRERSGIGHGRGAEATVLAGGGVTAPAAGSGRGAETSVAEPQEGLWTSVVATVPLGEP